MTNPTTLEDFEAIELRAEETGIFLRRFGLGPAVLLLHGFPQTHLMWRWDSVPVLLEGKAGGFATSEEFLCHV
jgi:pimeloyl-ACP methyl ester carboxylesterase